MLFLSFAVFAASAGRALSYYRIIIDKSYENVEGVCDSIVPKPLRKYRKIKIMDCDGNESTMLLGKQSKVKIGYRTDSISRKHNIFLLAANISIPLCPRIISSVMRSWVSLRQKQLNND